MTTRPTDPGRPFALEVVRRLRDAGFEALWAGGCVRDLLLGLEPKDYDVATSATPEQVQNLFHRTVPVGASFGVVRVCGRRGSDVEVATFRTDLSYHDGRHPDAIAFSTPEEDAKRRDFTINGMFYDPIAEQVHDYVGGRVDLERRVLRAIGEPTRRFTEDKLRLLRAARMAARFQLEIESATADAVQAMASEITVVSAERILAELQLMFMSPTRVDALRLLRQLALFPHVLPEPNVSLLSEENWNAALRIVGTWSREVSFPLVVAGLLTFQPDATVAADADLTFRRLKASNDQRDRAVWLVARRHDFDAARHAPLHLLKRRFADPGCDELLDLHEATQLAMNGTRADADYCRRLRAELGPETINPQPLLTGNDLISAGFEPGPRFKSTIEAVRDAQLDGRINSAEEALVLARQCLEVSSMKAKRKDEAGA